MSKLNSLLQTISESLSPEEEAKKIRGKEDKIIHWIRKTYGNQMADPWRNDFEETS